MFPIHHWKIHMLVRSIEWVDSWYLESISRVGARKHKLVCVRVDPALELVVRHERGIRGSSVFGRKSQAYFSASKSKQRGTVGDQ